MTQTRAYLLLGGMLGPDGEFDSAGMDVLIPMLDALPETTAVKYEWQQFGVVDADIREHPNTNIVVIGFSGGGSRATYLRSTIDLMILYDPSPANETHPIQSNVKRVICYHNTNPMMFGLGGGQAVAAKGNGITRITTINIAVPHLAVQNEVTLHNATVSYVKELINA